MVFSKAPGLPPLSSIALINMTLAPSSFSSFWSLAANSSLDWRADSRVADSSFCILRKRLARNSVSFVSTSSRRIERNFSARWGLEALAAKMMTSLFPISPPLADSNETMPRASSMVSSSGQLSAPIPNKASCSGPNFLRVSRITSGRRAVSRIVS